MVLLVTFGRDGVGGSVHQVDVWSDGPREDARRQEIADVHLGAYRVLRSINFLGRCFTISLTTNGRSHQRLDLTFLNLSRTSWISLSACIADGGSYSGVQGRSGSLSQIQSPLHSLIMLLLSRSYERPLFSTPSRLDLAAASAPVISVDSLHALDWGKIGNFQNPIFQAVTHLLTVIRIYECSTLRFRESSNA